MLAADAGTPKTCPSNVQTCGFELFRMRVYPNSLWICHFDVYQDDVSGRDLDGLIVAIAMDADVFHFHFTGTDRYDCSSQYVHISEDYLRLVTGRDQCAIVVSYGDIRDLNR